MSRLPLRYATMATGIGIATRAQASFERLTKQVAFNDRLIVESRGIIAKAIRARDFARRQLHNIVGVFPFTSHNCPACGQVIIGGDSKQECDLCAATETVAQAVAVLLSLESRAIPASVVAHLEIAMSTMNEYEKKRRNWGAR